MWIGTALAIGCTALLAMVAVTHAFDDYASARHRLFDVASYRQVLDTANGLSAERGPANSVMGEDAAQDTASRRRLVEVRMRNDAALERLGAETFAPFGLGLRGARPSPLHAVEDRLATARAEVDRVAAMPQDQRGMEDVEAAIDAMFSVVDTFQAVTRSIADDILKDEPSLASPVLTGQVLADLREYAGRLGSEIVAPMAVGRPLPSSVLAATSRTRGRILELWQLARSQDALYASDPRTQRARQDAERLFFGEGLAIMDGLAAEGRSSGHYSLTPAQMTARYVPTFAPIDALRAAFLDMTVEHFTAVRDHALAVLVTVSAIAVVIVGLLIVLVAGAQTHLFCPLLAARDEVIALAEDRIGAVPARRTVAAAELSRLFDAIDTLRERMCERAFLTRQLRRQAETDGLTGLLNRHRLDVVGQEASAVPCAEPVCLILMDIDHFKHVNDRYGHLTGDRVLTEIADVIRAHVRPADVAARFGGEEFALLIGGCALPQAQALAATLRAAVQAHETVAAEGSRLRVTASFGIAAAPHRPFDWMSLIAEADAALYRAKSEGRNRVRCGTDPRGPDSIDPCDQNDVAAAEIGREVLRRRA